SSFAVHAYVHSCVCMWDWAEGVNGYLLLRSLKKGLGTSGVNHLSFLVSGVSSGDKKSAGLKLASRLRWGQTLINQLTPWDTDELPDKQHRDSQPSGNESYIHTVLPSPPHLRPCPATLLQPQRDSTVGVISSIQTAIHLQHPLMTARFQWMLQSTQQLPSMSLSFSVSLCTPSAQPAVAPTARANQVFHPNLNNGHLTSHHGLIQPPTLFLTNGQAAAGGQAVPSAADIQDRPNGMKMLRTVRMGKYKFSDPRHPKGKYRQMLKELKQKRRAKEFTDLKIIVEGKEFEVHQNVLASCSLYFKDLVKRSSGETRSGEVLQLSMSNISAVVLEMLLEFTLLEAANKFQSVCVYVLLAMAEAMSCTELHNMAKAFALQNFPEVAVQEEILIVSKEDLVSYLSNDSLNTKAEELVYETVIKWIKQDPDSRVQESELMAITSVNKICHNCWCLPFIHPSYLLNVVDNEELIKSSEACQDLVNEAKRYHMLPHARQEMQTPRTRPRLSAGTHTHTHTHTYGGRKNDCILYIRWQGGVMVADVWCYMSLLDNWNLVSWMTLARCRHNSLSHNKQQTPSTAPSWCLKILHRVTDMIGRFARCNSLSGSLKPALGQVKSMQT
uniref:Kelch-like family member 29 n=1 Tax=Labrus bergylta TaxID=56723 RepID=A0A3Q3KSN2_9LABR